MAVNSEDILELHCTTVAFFGAAEDAERGSGPHIIVGARPQLLDEVHKQDIVVADKGRSYYLSRMAKRYWLMKSEPNVFSFADLEKSPQRSTFWDGVRNYQARNLLKNEIQVGDEVLFYHSRVEPMAVVGVAKVAQAGTPDPTQFDPRSKYHDPDAKKDAPRWYGVTITHEHAFATPVTLQAMRTLPGLDGMVLLKKGSRLSVQPVDKQHFELICSLGST
jgi:predicted RNA-binding protein with PUA-like domain